MWLKQAKGLGVRALELAGHLLESERNPTQMSLNKKEAILADRTEKSRSNGFRCMLIKALANMFSLYFCFASCWVHFKFRLFLCGASSQLQFQWKECTSSSEVWQPPGSEYLEVTTITAARVCVPHPVIIPFPFWTQARGFVWIPIEIHPTRLNLLIKSLEELSKLAYEQKFMLFPDFTVANDLMMVFYYDVQNDAVKVECWESIMVVTKDRGIRETVVKGHKLPVRRWIRSGDLMHSIVIIVNNAALFLRVATGLDLKCSRNKREMVIGWCVG